MTEASRNLIAGWLIAGAGAVLAAQSPPTLFRSSSDVVAVYATVRDAQGRLAIGLSKEDFEVRENGTVREIAAFSNEIQQITLAMILDRSGSLATRSREVTAAAVGFLAALRPGDRVSLGSLSWDCVPLTGDVERLRRAVGGRMPEDPGSPIWQSIDRAFFAHEREPGRRAILMFSDGADTGMPFMPFLGMLGRAGGCTAAGGATGASMREVATRAERNGVLVYAVGVETQGRRMDGDLRTLARNTGGELFRLKDDEPMTPVFERIAEELHHQYLLGFVPATRAGVSGKIEVRVKRSGFTVRARRSFMVAPDTTRSAASTTPVVAGPLSDEEVAAAVKEGLAGRSLRSTCHTQSTTAAGSYFEVMLEGPVARVMRAAREARQARVAFGVGDVPDRLRQPEVRVSVVGLVPPALDAMPGSAPPGSPPAPMPQRASPSAVPFATAIHIRSLSDRPVFLRPIVTDPVRMRSKGPSEADFDLNAFRALGDAIEVIVASFLGEARCRLSPKALELVR